MNTHAILSADDLPRRAFTVAEVERMVELGLLHEDDRIELIGGDLVEMSPKGNRHELVKQALLKLWFKAAPDEIELIPETTFRLSPDTYLEPDVCFYDRTTGIAGLNGDTALLVVEIADTSLGFDLGRKAPIYSSFGVRELWVIDAATLKTHIHRDPGPDGYRAIEVREPGETIAPGFSGGEVFALRLEDLGLEPGDE